MGSEREVGRREEWKGREGGRGDRGQNEKGEAKGISNLPTRIWLPRVHPRVPAVVIYQLSLKHGQNRSL